MITLISNNVMYEFGCNGCDGTRRVVGRDRAHVFNIVREHGWLAINEQRADSVVIVLCPNCLVRGQSRKDPS